MHRRLASVIVMVGFLVVACDTRPQAPEFAETTTTTTTLPGGAPPSTTTPTLPPEEERVTGSVLDVTDGDTLSVSIDGIPTDVRMLGINAPEMTECWGPEAATVLANRLNGREVLLIAGEEDLDSFGRALRYVYLESPDGIELVNAELVRDGNAVALQNGHEYAAEWKAFEARAFQSGKGMWGTFACGDDEGLRADRPVIRIGEVSFDPSGPDDDALADEFVTIVNEGYGRVAISGWILRDESSSNRLAFPDGTVLAPGESVTVITGCEGGPANAIRWCSDTPVWSNGGDTVIVSDTLGNAVIWYTYDGSGA